MGFMQAMASVTRQAGSEHRKTAVVEESVARFLVGETSYLESDLSGAVYQVNVRTYRETDGSESREVRRVFQCYEAPKEICEHRKTAAVVAPVLADPNTEACASARRELVKALRAYQEVVTLDEFQHLGRSFMELYGFLLLADAEVAK